MEAEAFERALRPLLRRSGGYALAILRERRDAEDAVQQAALQAWRARARFDPARPFGGWWFAILRHQCLDQLRRRGREPVAVDHAHAGLASPPDESALDRVALGAAIEALTEAQRDVLRLRYFGELTYEELSHALDIPLGTVMSRLHLARKALAARLRTEEA